MSKQSRDYFAELAGQASSALGPSAPSLPKQFRHLPELHRLLQRANGFYAFDDALHVFPLLGSSQSAGGLEWWNREQLWKNSFGELLPPELTCFAEDLFGGQFAAIGSKIVRLDPETGETEDLAENLDAWAALMLRDTSYQTGSTLASEWTAANGRIEAGMRLLPKVPFTLGGEFSIENLFALEAVQGMCLRGEIAQQLAGLPDGAPVEITYY